MLRGIRHQLVNHHRDRLGLRGGEHDLGAADRGICVGRVGRKLVVDEAGKAHAGPAALA